MTSLKTEFAGRSCSRALWFVAALRRIGMASALGAMALAPLACGGPGDGTDNTNESSENMPEALRRPLPWRGLLTTRANDAGAAVVMQTSAAASSTSSVASSSTATPTMAGSTSMSSVASSSAAAPATASSAAAPTSGASGSTSAFWFPPIGDFGTCPAMVQQIGFGECTQDEILKTCTLASGTICECIRVDGEGQTPEIVCPAPGL